MKTEIETEAVLSPEDVKSSETKSAA